MSRAGRESRPPTRPEQRPHQGQGFVSGFRKLGSHIDYFDLSYLSVVDPNGGRTLGRGTAFLRETPVRSRATCGIRKAGYVIVSCLASRPSLVFLAESQKLAVIRVTHA
jgi:hypothetical protein